MVAEARKEAGIPKARLPQLGHANSVVGPAVHSLTHHPPLPMSETMAPGAAGVAW